MVEISRRLSRIQYMAMVYNTLEATLTICFGIVAQSVALIGFGIISTMESLESLIVISSLHRGSSKKLIITGSVLKKPMLSVAIFSFFGGSWVLIQSLRALILLTPPSASLLGIIISLCSLLVMPLLAYWVYQNHELSQIIVIKMGFHDIWAYMLLSLGLLGALCLNYFWGFWRADPIIGFIISGFLYKKSFDNIIDRGKETSKD